MRKTTTIAKVPFLAPDVVTKIIPSPTDGWDAISPLAEMDPKRAPILENWVPRTGFVELRGGYVPFAFTALSTPVETLMVYRAPSSEKMFAAAGTKIYDVSAGGSSTASVTGLTSARWQYTNFTPGGGTNVIQCVNGVDSLRQYDGSSWTTPSITGLPGGSTANIINIHSQKRRLWYVMNNTATVAFMPTDAISGPISGTINFGSIWSKGGYLIAMSNWTIDGSGSGPQDMAMFVSSRGQVTIYQGVDPTNANDWKLLGTFDILPPVSRRCLLRVGSDVSVLTQGGVIPISQALPFDPSADRSVAITARIQNAMAQAAMTAQSNFGWQMITYPNQQLAILNVPLVENSQAQQYVMNTLTGAWCTFTGWNANCFEIYNNNLYWGDNLGAVNQGYVGGADLLTSIAADMQCAYNWFDEPGRVKRMTMVQPLLTIGGQITPTLAVDTDFLASNASAPVTNLAGTTLWDAAIWDTSLWPALIINYSKWLTVNAIGHALALRVRVNVNFYSSSASVALFDYAQFDVSLFDASLSTALPTLQVNAFNSVCELGGAI